MMLFSVEILSRPGTEKNPGERCPICRTKLGQDGAITELDIDEIRPQIDEEVIREWLPL